MAYAPYMRLYNVFICTIHSTKYVFRHRKWYLAMENRHHNGDTPMKKLIRYTQYTYITLFYS